MNYCRTSAISGGNSSSAASALINGVMLHRTRFEELKALGKLPSPYGVALEIVRLSQKHDATVEEVAKLIRMDPALTGRLIEFANSTRAGKYRPIVAVADAVMCLGLSTVRGFMLGLSVIRTNQAGACRSFNYREFWARSFMRAWAVEAITTREPTVVPEEAFTCGLLSDIGRLALASVYPDGYDQCLNSVSPDQDEDLVVAERERFSIDHRQVTAELLKNWGLPAIFLKAVASQYILPPGLPASHHPRVERFAAQHRLAAILGRSFTATAAARAGLIERAAFLARGLGLTQPDLDELWNRLAQHWQASSQLFDPPTSERPLPKPATFTCQKPDADRPPSSCLRILLLAEHRAEIDSWEKLLREEGHILLRANDADEAIQVVIREPVQLVIAAHTPGVNATRFGRLLRSLEGGRQIYLIVLAAASDEALHVEAFDSGADDFLVAPVDGQVLAAHVRGGRRVIELHKETVREHREVGQFVHELAVAKRKLEVIAMTDMLTNIPNRRYAFARLNDEWAVWRRTGHPLTLMVVDLDHFKQINDRLGHPMGDQVLAHTARIIRSTLRRTDVVCRLGGEEFLVIAPNTDSAVAKMLGERLRGDVEQFQIKAASLPRLVTVSVGIAVSDRHTTNEQELLQRADQALYRAKQAGRNGVRLF